MSKLRLYLYTALHLKPSQIAYRIWRKCGGCTCLRVGYRPCPDAGKADIRRVPALSEIDFDPVFLARFDVDALIDDKVELLNHQERVDWNTSWHADLSTPLWRFNLHYFEYLLPLGKAYLDSGDSRYLDKAKAVISSWIQACPQFKGGPAWDSYTISMRAVNWLAFYSELQGHLDEDAAFMELFNRSLTEQFAYLACHLEVDLLANHYLEDLKATVILSCYFDDKETLGLALPKLMAQIREQILPDGMHFELSPMYHKIVLEDLMRAAIALKTSEFDSDVCKDFRLQDMCDCLYSLERNANRTPLFNDCGDNVAKSRDALLSCAKIHFGVEPDFRPVFPDAGYCVIERKTEAGIVKVIFDTGNPGPKYAMGHVHCDALSFECFINGEPWIVNCGTYAYQDASRLDYKNTLSHSTVTVKGMEQHECWAPFRVARFGRGELIEYGESNVRARFFYPGDRYSVIRTIEIGDEGLFVSDEEQHGAVTESAFIFHESIDLKKGIGRIDRVSYAPNFGEHSYAGRLIFEGGLARDSFLEYPQIGKRHEC